MDFNLFKNEMKNKGYDDNRIDNFLNYAKKLHSNNISIIFDLTHLALLLELEKKVLYSYITLSDNLYKEIKILKKNGNIRVLDAPSENLKYIQRWILKNILNPLPVSKNAKGFRLGLSIVDNAEPHLKSECLINLDLKDFFPNIKFKEVFILFRELGYSLKLSFLFAKLTTYKGYLPQGAPTSPIIANLLCNNLDKRLDALALTIGATYTRYADDLTFSGNSSITRALPLIKKIILDENFLINDNKERILYKHNQQRVTGIIVNSKLSVPIKIKKYLRQQIYFAKKFGVYSSLEFQEKAFISNYKEHLYGLVHFIKMVEKEKALKFYDELDSINWDS